MLNNSHHRLLVGLPLVLVLLFCRIDMTAQTIADGSKWWDGTRLYTAQVDEKGNVTMVGESEEQGIGSFRLKKALGYYTLAADPQTGGMTIRGQVGWRVEYISQDDVTFLAVRKPNKDCVYALTLTSDNLKDCVSRQKADEGREGGWLMQNRLLTAAYLGRFAKSQLRLMRNEILARRGWIFQSKDLKDYFSSQSWYHPVGNNNSIISIIERVNIELIKSEEALSANERVQSGGIVPRTNVEVSKRVEEAPKKNDEVAKKAEEAPKKVEEVLKKVEEAPKKTEETLKIEKEVPIIEEEAPKRVEPVVDKVIFVSTEEQFLKALGNNRVVEIGTNVHLNLSRILSQRDLFSGVAGRFWMTKAERGGNTPEVISEFCDDGRQLTLKNFSNLVIRGQNNSSIEVEPRYAFCLNLIDCKNCRLENLTIGHTEDGYCEGGVIGIKGGRDNSIMSCDLYGCGTYGIVASETDLLSVFYTNIHDCTYGIMELWDSDNILFEDCDFFSNREFDLISNMNSANTVFKGCRFYDNWPDVALFVSNLDIKLYHCEIYHPVIGSKRRLLEPDKDCTWSNEEHYVPKPRMNAIGPDAKLRK